MDDAAASPYGTRPLRSRPRHAGPRRRLDDRGRSHGTRPRVLRPFAGRLRRAGLPVRTVLRLFPGQRPQLEYGRAPRRGSSWRLVAQPAVRLGTPHVRIATRLEVRASATPIAGARIACRAAVGRRSLKLLSARLARGTAICVWRLTSGGRVTGSIVLAAPEGRTSHMFTARVPKALRRA